MYYITLLIKDTLLLYDRLFTLLHGRLFTKKQKVITHHCSPGCFAPCRILFKKRIMRNYNTSLKINCFLYQSNEVKEKNKIPLGLIYTCNIVIFSFFDVVPPTLLHWSWIRPLLLSYTFHIHFSYLLTFFKLIIWKSF